MAESGVLLGFGVFAGVIFSGVVAHRVFQRTGIPDVIPLLGLGVLLGPVLHILDPASIGAAAPYIGAFALLVILLEGGLELNYHHVVEKAWTTTILTLVSLVLTTLVVAGVAAALGIPAWPQGVLLGLILAPLSASVLVPMLGGLRMQEETRALLSLECTLGEALAIIAVFAASAAALAGSLEVGGLAAQLGTTFGLGVLGALVAGLAWLELLRFLGRTPYSYMVTLAAAVGLFAGMEAIGGNGYVAVLVFGLVLSNAMEISAHLPPVLRTTVQLGDTVRWMNTEVTFFVRTFFFVYLGLLVRPEAFGPAGLTLGLAALAGVLLARALSVGLLVRLKPSERPDAPLLVALVPRGLATAVLAAVPVALGVPGAQAFVEVAAVLVVLTNAAMAVGIVALRRRGEPGGPAGEGEAPKGASEAPL